MLKNSGRPEVSDFGADQKERGLWGRELGLPNISYPWCSASTLRARELRYYQFSKVPRHSLATLRAHATIQVSRK